MDSVRRCEVVTADGQMRTASADENADLFWALRGGGGGFAVVTGMEVQLYPVTTVFGGNLVYPGELAGQVLRRFREWIQTLPEEFTAAFALMNLPPLPMVPEFLRGKSVVMVRGCYCGPVEQGQAPGTTVVNPLFATSPIPAGSCVVTGSFPVPLTLTGNETEDVVITVSLSTNKSFEWLETDGDNVFEPANGETVVDMGIRGMQPIVQ